MELFCTTEECLAAEKRRRRFDLAFRILAGLTPAVFIVLCLLVRTANAGTMHAAMLCTAALLGGAAVTVFILFLQPARRELKHLNMLYSGDRETRTGRMTVTGERFRIPKSVRVCRVVLDRGEGEREDLLNIDERWEHRLPADGSLVRLTTVHSYIAGLEVLKSEGPRTERYSPSCARVCQAA